MLCVQHLVFNRDLLCAVLCACKIRSHRAQAVGVELNKKGAIVVDQYSHTNVDSIWALGVSFAAYVFGVSEWHHLT